MNKKGFFDLEMESMLPILLALLGGFIAWFTATGGFSYYVTGETYESSAFIQIASAVGGALIGYVWGTYQSS